MKQIRILTLMMFILYSCTTASSNEKEKISNDDYTLKIYESNRNKILKEYNIAIEDDLDEILNNRYTFQIMGNIVGKNLLLKECNVIDITKENDKFYVFINSVYNQCLLKLETTNVIVDKILNSKLGVPFENLVVINLNTFNDVKLKYKLEMECNISDEDRDEDGNIIEDSIELDKYQTLIFEKTFYGEGKLLILDF